jgi:hypothetical protein
MRQCSDEGRKNNSGYQTTGKGEKEKEKKKGQCSPWLLLQNEARAEGRQTGNFLQ